MKLSGFILIILVVGLSFALVASVISDFETQYPEVDVNTTWEDDYDYTEEINESVYGIKTRFDIVGNEETGWFSKLTVGISAIPLAIIFIPVVIFKTMTYAIEILSNVAVDIGVPPFVIIFAIIALIVIILFGLVAFWHRSKI